MIAVLAHAGDRLRPLTTADLEAPEPTPCIRCGRCIDVCPLGLAPTKIGLASRDGRWDVARRYDIAACCECGCCGYVCPAHIPLVQYIRAGKEMASAGAGVGKISHTV